MFFSEPKIESKDHKWRDAPVVGVSQDNKENTTKATSMRSSLPDFVANTAQYGDEELEGGGKQNPPKKKLMSYFLGYDIFLID